MFWQIGAPIQMEGSKHLVPGRILNPLFCMAIFSGDIQCVNANKTVVFKLSFNNVVWDDCGRVCGYLCGKVSDQQNSKHIQSCLGLSEIKVDDISGRKYKFHSTEL